MSESFVDRIVQEDVGLPIFPRSPLLSSRRTAWQSIYLEHHYQPINTTPEWQYDWHVISVHLGRPTLIEQWIDNGQAEKGFVRDGDVAIYRANSRYRERYHGDTEFIDLHLEPALLMRTANELAEIDRPEIVPLFSTRDPLIQQIGLALKTELEFAANHFYAEAMANALAVHLLRHYSSHKLILAEPTGGLSAHKLRHSIDYIQAHLDQNLTVATIAQSVQLSPYHFSRLFKQSTGLSPHQYVIRCRIDRAQQLLQQGLPIAEVAHHVGFAHQSHLNRHFKRLLGVTPKTVLSR